MDYVDFKNEFRYRLSKDLWLKADALFLAFEKNFSDDIGEMISAAFHKKLAAEVIDKLTRYRSHAADMKWSINDPKFRQTPEYQKVRKFFREEIYSQTLGEKLVTVSSDRKK